MTFLGKLLMLSTCVVSLTLNVLVLCSPVAYVLISCVICRWCICWGVPLSVGSGETDCWMREGWMLRVECDHSKIRLHLPWEARICLRELIILVPTSINEGTKIFSQYYSYWTTTCYLCFFLLCLLYYLSWDFWGHNSSNISPQSDFKFMFLRNSKEILQACLCLLLYFGQGRPWPNLGWLWWRLPWPQLELRDLVA